MIKFGLKVGIAAGACYYLAEEGVWKESTETSKLYSRLGNAISPMIKEVTAQVPIQIPELPNSKCISYMTKQYWNAGVTNTFSFIGDLPEHISGWTESGMKALGENPEVRKLVDSVKAPPVPAPAPAEVEKQKQ